MDAVIIAAIITAASKAARSIFQRIMGGAGARDPTVRLVVSENYSELKKLVTPHCVELLKFAEDGTYHDLSEFRTHLYPDITFADRAEENRFNHEFEYRLRYLVATGFFTSAMGEYYIS